jgi:hypothetical protein
MCKHNHLYCYWSVYKWQPTAPVVERTTIDSAARHSSDVSSGKPLNTAPQHLIPLQGCIMSNVRRHSFRELVAGLEPEGHEHPAPGLLDSDQVAAHPLQPVMHDIPSDDGPSSGEFPACWERDWQQNPPPWPLDSDPVAAHSFQPNMGDIPGGHAPSFGEFHPGSGPDWPQYPPPWPLDSDPVAAHYLQPNQRDIPGEDAFQGITSPAQGLDRIVWDNGRPFNTGDGGLVWRCGHCKVPASEYLPCCIVTARFNLTGLS